jgi:hypothetical protein
MVARITKTTASKFKKPKDKLKRKRKDKEDVEPQSPEVLQGVEVSAPRQMVYVETKLDVDSMSAKELSNFVLSRQRNKLTPKLIDQFFQMGDRGVPFDAVCDALRVSKANFHQWVRRGELFLESEGGNDPEEAIYALFVQRMKESTASYRHRIIEELHTPDQGNDWIRLMTILERRDKRNFSRQDLAGAATDASDRDEAFL